MEDRFIKDFPALPTFNSTTRYDIGAYHCDWLYIISLATNLINGFEGRPAYQNDRFVDYSLNNTNGLNPIELLTILS